MSGAAGIRALILAGGSGTRLWPRSTEGRPKPFLSLTGRESLLREALRRAGDLAGEGNVFVSGRAAHEALLLAALPEIPRARLVLEPVRRNTAPAIALSALAASEDAPDAVLAVLPSDQAVRDEPAFLAALRAAAETARTHDGFVTIGIPPSRPETGFGYLEIEREEISADEKKEGREKISENGRRGGAVAFKARQVVRFVEKPALPRAQEFLASGPGRFLWNAGIFVFRIPYFFEELSRVAPEILDLARRAHAALKAGALSSFTEIFSSSPSVSIDVALMEKAQNVLAIPCDCGWSDLGSWDAVFEFRGGTSEGNVLEGAAEAVDGTGNLVLAGSRPVRLVGLSDVVVVESPDGLLVMRRGASDALRRSVEEGLSR
jgi:mannose-1-phosphate guanylyltransferase/mannose-6-phosphate isomerase